MCKFTSLPWLISGSSSQNSPHPVAPFCFLFLPTKVSHFNSKMRPSVLLYSLAASFAVAAPTAAPTKEVAVAANPEARGLERIISILCTEQGCGTKGAVFDLTIPSGSWGQKYWNIHVPRPGNGHYWKEWHVFANDAECHIQKPNGQWSPYRRGPVSLPEREGSCMISLAKK